MNMKENITPYSGKILIKRITEEKSEGIIIPDNMKEKPTRGEVISVGKPVHKSANEHSSPIDLKAGDIVIYTKWAGTEIEKDSGLVILSESDILAKISK
ncbi:chaperone GroES [Candidatus Fokinia solitaria]|uniref:10 kDa chaperonin n=2 Tax=Candidatus Fokinia solitaria TaxID=1802984 RepID=A0A2U8BRX7_9RICK|nr:chaperone GroES [Candidatus Fokinia solitaria]